MNTRPSEQAHWQRPFFAIWTGQAFSLLGSSLAGFALVWWLTATTGSATVLAVGTLVQILPQVLLGPVAGALIDRWRRRQVMLVADSLIALFSLWLALLFATGHVALWHVYAILLIRAIGNIFHFPAMQAATPLMVPEKHLSRVAGMNQTLQGIINIIAPPAGALLLGLFPIHTVLLLDVGTALLAVLPLCFIAIPETARAGGTAASTPTAGGRTSVGQDLREGLRFVRGWPGLLIVMAMAAIINFMGIPTRSFIPLLVTQHFGLGVLHLGWMQTASGVGIICGGLALAAWGGFRRRIITALTGVMALGAGVLLMGIAPPQAFPLALGGHFLMAFAAPFVDGIIFAMLQAIVPPGMQGRVMTLLLSVAAATAPLSLILAGPVVDALGAPFWFILSGLCTLLVGGVGFFVPALLHIETQRLPDK